MQAATIAIATTVKTCSPSELQRIILEKKGHIQFVFSTRSVPKPVWYCTA